MKPETHLVSVDDDRDLKRELLLHLRDCGLQESALQRAGRIGFLGADHRRSKTNWAETPRKAYHRLIVDGRHLESSQLCGHGGRDDERKCANRSLSSVR